MIILLIHIAPLAYGSIELDITNAKNETAKFMEQKFSYRGQLNGSYGFAGKKHDQEDLDALIDLGKILKKINNPKDLSSFTSIYITTEELKSSIRLVKGQNSIIIAGRKLDALKVINFFSTDPNSEPSFQSLSEAKRKSMISKLSLHMEEELVDALNLISALKCENQIHAKDDFELKLEESSYNILPKKDYTPSQNLELENNVNFQKLIQEAQRKEKATLRLEKDDFLNAVLHFDEDNQLVINLQIKSPEKSVRANLSKNCEFSNLMIRTTENQIVTEIIHLDYEFNVTKKVRNNQTRLTGKQRFDLTAVATLDSGLDYNHPSIINNLIPSRLNKNEEHLFERSKDHFINNDKITKKIEKDKSAILNDIPYEQKSLSLAEDRYQKHFEQVKAYEEQLSSANAEMSQLNKKLVADRSAIKNLQADKFIMLKPGKQAKLRELQSSIRNTESSIYFKSNDITSLQARIKSQKSFEQGIVTNLNKHQLALNQSLAKKEEILKLEAEHLLMLDIFTRGVSAWNFHDDNDKPSDFWDGMNSVMFESYDHGTHVSGIIIEGATDELVIFPMRYPKQSMIDFEDSKEKKVYQAVELAYKKGVRVLNISMGTTTPESKTPSDKIKNDRRARDSWKSIQQAAQDFPDMLFVCAAGNDGVNADELGHYPSGFENNNILSVAAVDEKNKLAEFSNYGKTTVDIAAPGVDIISLVPGGDTGIKSGTSMATPYVSRVAGRIEHINPSLGPADIKNILAATVIKTSELAKTTVYGGAIDEQRAIEKACASLDKTERLTKKACRK